MPYVNLPLSALEVNPNNDRHGEQGSEQRAISWLLSQRATHMRNLAADVVTSAGIFEPPLVFPAGAKYVVADGNRRVTTLKLLSQPELAPTREFEEFYRQQRALWSGEFPAVINCQVETDRDRIDEILYRRHTGVQGGVGQSQWDGEATLNFVQRTGKRTRIDVAAEVAKLLHTAGYEREAELLPRSNFNRFMSAETFRNRLGFSTRGNTLQLTHDEDEVLRALRRVANDLIEKKVVLADLWDNDGKRRYVESLAGDGVLPTHAHALQTPRAPSGTRRASPSPVAEPETRGQGRPQTINRLIPPDLEYAVVWTGATQRHREIWDELQHRLNMDDHPNAVGVMLRVLLDLSIEHAVERLHIECGPNDNLSKKLAKLVTQFASSGSLDAKHAEDLGKFRQQEELLSAHTMNRYVHSPRFMPSPEHLRVLWAGLSAFIVLCLNA